LPAFGWQRRPAASFGKLLSDRRRHAVLVVVAFMFSLLALVSRRGRRRIARLRLPEVENPPPAPASERADAAAAANRQEQQPGGLVIEGEVIGERRIRSAKPRAAASGQAANDLPARPTEPPGKTADG
jgi:hypothetical protein